ncbi:hypothetical protein PUNSTDRAFT_136527 [Punctularia strigosozonata HHB-11173 SS5]|uniref:uncharacterized protein n=1 Tax=Punctularia strigosozonata (strain HHB-11173) TaxID=741275 RepID=UPI00044162E7|nr:uncharacterized protein PUNSTDRAFT_136527 [Punctularia strigosozonata HHB-11173 SS5]EIN06684.1 hypothetical protein PUNSTDRAFT_136527 [Punctularia strigosozonata HHB-11173 SS5]
MDYCDPSATLGQKAEMLQAMHEDPAAQILIVDNQSLVEMREKARNVLDIKLKEAKDGVLSGKYKSARAAAIAVGVFSRLALEEEKVRLANANEKRVRGSTKIKGRIVVAQELKAHFEEELLLRRRGRHARRSMQKLLKPPSVRLVLEDVVGLAQALHVNDKGPVRAIIPRIHISRPTKILLQTLASQAYSSSPDAPSMEPAPIPHHIQHL